jgi:hypothetical protein
MLTDILFSVLGNGRIVSRIGAVVRGVIQHKISKRGRTVARDQFNIKSAREEELLPEINST